MSAQRSQAPWARGRRPNASRSSHATGPRAAWPPQPDSQIGEGRSLGSMHCKGTCALKSKALLFDEKEHVLLFAPNWIKGPCTPKGLEVCGRNKSDLPRPTSSRVSGSLPAWLGARASHRCTSTKVGLIHPCGCGSKPRTPGEPPNPN